jgi:hypothetical protein
MTEKPKRPIVYLQFDGEEPFLPPATEPVSLGYTRGGDVPTPVRHTIRDLFNSGRSVAWLSEMFGVPEEWVVFFVLPGDGEDN